MVTGSVLARYPAPPFRDTEFHLVFAKEQIAGPNNCLPIRASTLGEVPRPTGLTLSLCERRRPGINVQRA
jgi:hypothetical protein